MFGHRFRGRPSIAARIWWSESETKKNQKRKRKIDTAEFHYNSAGTRNSTQDDPLESDERKDEKKNGYFFPQHQQNAKKKMASEDPVDHRLSWRPGLGESPVAPTSADGKTNKKQTNKQNTNAHVRANNKRNEQGTKSHSSIVDSPLRTSLDEHDTFFSLEPAGCWILRGRLDFFISVPFFLPEKQKKSHRDRFVVAQTTGFHNVA